MRRRACLLLAVTALTALLVTSESSADIRHIGDREAISGQSCGEDLCLFTATSIEELVDDFIRAKEEARERRLRKLEAERRARAAQRRAERRAEEARRTTYVSDSEARVPRLAPRPVKQVVEAANSIATTPYIWGGGHGSFESPGYDCSGAVSFALHGGGFLDSPLDSTGLSAWGEEGPGRWITVYANGEHAWMVIAGLAFDTSGNADGTGPRWHESPPNSPDGFIVRHPPGF